MIAFQEIRNATFKLAYPDVTFLFDPWLSDACTQEERERALAEGRFVEKPMVGLPASPQEIVAGVDYFIVSHLHADHFMPDYLPFDAPFVFQSEADAQVARKMGFTNVSFFQDEPLTFGSVTMRRVDAQHGDNAVQVEKAGPASGFVLTSDAEKTVYVAGDTVFTDNVKALIERFAPAYVVVNACAAQGRFGRLIMNVGDVVKTCECSAECRVIVSHMDTVSHARLSRAQLREALAGTPYDQQVLIPEDNERIEL